MQNQQLGANSTDFDLDDVDENVIEGIANFHNNYPSDPNRSHNLLQKQKQLGLEYNIKKMNFTNKVPAKKHNSDVKLLDRFIPINLP